jgi:membrane-anchored protein YejM (alkaline phosphatase superfamily)
MNRRRFCKNTFLGIAAFYASSASTTRHVIFIIAGGMRKREYLENPSLAPNFRRVAIEGFVFQEDHCERVASHTAAFAELLQGREYSQGGSAYPTLLDHIGSGIQVDSLQMIPYVMQRYRPRIVVCRDTSHDVGHTSYERYLSAVKTTDGAVGSVFDWVKRHPDFARNTAIVIRPEFGRDDEVNEHGHLHHSYGFYYTHRVASIFWGPDFNRGVDGKTVISALDMAPTLTKLFGVDAIHAQGRVVPGLFRSDTAR